MTRVWPEDKGRGGGKRKKQKGKKIIYNTEGNEIKVVVQEPQVLVDPVQKIVWNAREIATVNRHRHTRTQTKRDRDRQTHGHTHMDTCMSMCDRHMDKRKETHKHIDRDKHTGTQTRIGTHIHTQWLGHTHKWTHGFGNNGHMDARICTHWHQHIYTYTTVFSLGIYQSALFPLGLLICPLVYGQWCEMVRYVGWLEEDCSGQRSLEVHGNGGSSKFKWAQGSTWESSLSHVLPCAHTQMDTWIWKQRTYGCKDMYTLTSTHMSWWEEEEKRDERKKRKEEGTQPATQDLKCEQPGCDFKGQTKAGLVSHVGRGMAMLVLQCPFCSQPFWKQCLTMHMRFCQMNPSRKKSRARAHWHQHRYGHTWTQTCICMHVHTH